MRKPLFSILSRCSLIFMAAILLTSNSYGQLTAHAGGYLKWCMATTLGPAPQLGGSPSATGGEPPYQYRWTCLTYNPGSPGSLSFPVPFDDSTAANPMAVAWDFGFYRDIDVQLRVTDAMGAVAYDTAHILTSGFAYLLGECVNYKTASGEVVLEALIGGGGFGRGPFSYRWTPNLYLSNDTIVNAICNAPVNMVYTLRITDSLGCSDTAKTPCYVYISNAANDIHKTPGTINIYPNPLTENTVIDVPASWAGSSISFYTMEGRLITRQLLQQEVTPADEHLRAAPAGMLYYRVRDVTGHTLTTGKVVK